MSTHLVKWSKPEPVRAGKSQLIMEGEFEYRSKCGRFLIKKDHMSSSRGHFNTVVYKFTVVATGKSRTCDTLAEAKQEANWEIDPNWEP